eukprot:14812040-Alexandrium_andersonii.AAC.1
MSPNLPCPWAFPALAPLLYTTELLVLRLAAHPVSDFGRSDSRPAPGKSVRVCACVRASVLACMQACV